jgi:hypothetical protein
MQRIRALADDPRPASCEKLSGQERYRIRQGAYRVIYEIGDARPIVLVVKVGHSVMFIAAAKKFVVARCGKAVPVNGKVRRYRAKRTK